MSADWTVTYKSKRGVKLHKSGTQFWFKRIFWQGDEDQKREDAKAYATAAVRRAKSGEEDIVVVLVVAPDRTKYTWLEKTQRWTKRSPK